MKQGVYWQYNDEPKSRKFWNISSDLYLYLGQLFIDFDFKFNQSLREWTSEFELTDAHLDYLTHGIEKRIEFLLQDYNPKVSSGLTWVTNEFKGVKYNFFVKMSSNHSLINGLIKFHKFLLKSKTNGKKIKFWGGIIE